MSSFLNLVLRENLCGSPFVSAIPKKHAAEALIGAGGLITGLLNWDAQTQANTQNYKLGQENLALQRETNEQNKLLAKEQNALNYRMFQEQNAWNEAMWNKQNVYNSPQAQLERLKAAGINPQGAVSSTPASQLTSADAKAVERAQMVAPQNNARMEAAFFPDFGDVVAKAVNAYNQTRLANAQTKNYDALTDNTVVQTEKEKRNMESFLQYWSKQATKEGWQGEFAKRQLDFFNTVFDAKVKLVNGDIGIQEQNQKILQEQLLGWQFDNKMKQIMQEFQVKMNEKELARMDAVLQEIKANIALTASRTDLTNQQKLTEVENTYNARFDKELKGIDKEIKNKTKQYVIDMAREQLSQSESKSYILGKEKENWVSGERLRRFSSIIPFTSATTKALF